MKKTLCIVTVLVLLLSMVAIAESIFTLPNIKLLFNGIRLIFLDDNNNVLPCIEYNGTVYIPAKEFVENIGGAYKYDVSTSTINISMNTNIAEQTARKEIKLTNENFLDYFSIKLKRSDFKCERGNTSPFGSKGGWYYYSENFTLNIEANAPFEIHNVRFKILQKAKHGTGSSVTRKTFTFDGAIPQNGSYTSTENYTWDNGLYSTDYLTFDGELKITNVEGYIVIQEEAETIAAKVAEDAKAKDAEAAALDKDLIALSKTIAESYGFEFDERVYKFAKAATLKEIELEDKEMFIEHYQLFMDTFYDVAAETMRQGMSYNDILKLLGIE